MLFRNLNVFCLYKIEILSGTLPSVIFTASSLSEEEKISRQHFCLMLEVNLKINPFFPKGRL